MSLQMKGDSMTEEHTAPRQRQQRRDPSAREQRALQAVDRLLAAAELVEPPATLAVSVMLKVERHRRRQERWRVCQTILYVLLGSLSLVAAPVLSLGALLRDNPAMLEVALTLWAKTSALGNAVTGAMETLVRAALGRQLGLIAIVWVALTVLLLLAWFGLVAGKRSQRWGGTDLAS